MLAPTLGIWVLPVLPNGPVPVQPINDDDKPNLADYVHALDLFPQGPALAHQLAEQPVPLQPLRCTLMLAAAASPEEAYLDSHHHKVEEGFNTTTTTNTTATTPRLQDDDYGDDEDTAEAEPSAAAADIARGPPDAAAAEVHQQDEPAPEHPDPPEAWKEGHLIPDDGHGLHCYYPDCSYHRGITWYRMLEHVRTKHGGGKYPKPVIGSHLHTMGLAEATAAQIQRRLAKPPKIKPGSAPSPQVMSRNGSRARRTLPRNQRSARL